MSWLPAILQVFSLLVASGPLFAQVDTCQQADNLREAGLNDEALVAYSSLLKDDPQLLCASEGIDALAATRADATNHYIRGVALATAGQTNEAWRRVLG